jgi:hypothetical protein
VIVTCQYLFAIVVDRHESVQSFEFELCDLSSSGPSRNLDVCAEFPALFPDPLNLMLVTFLVRMRNDTRSHQLEVDLCRKLITRCPPKQGALAIRIEEFVELRTGVGMESVLPIDGFNGKVLHFWQRLPALSFESFILGEIDLYTLATAACPDRRTT